MDLPVAVLSPARTLELEVRNTERSLERAFGLAVGTHFRSGIVELLDFFNLGLALPAAVGINGHRYDTLPGIRQPIAPLLTLGVRRFRAHVAQEVEAPGLSSGSCRFEADRAYSLAQWRNW